MNNQAAQTMPEFKPCPFCGGTNNLHLRNTHSASFWVRCDDCSAMVSGKSFDGRHRSKRFSYDPEAPECDPLSARTIGELHPEYQKAAHSAINRWNRRATALSQTAGVPDVLFDGYAVYQGMTDEARARINAGGVSDVLDSVVRLIRAQAAPAASGGEVSHVTIDFPQVGTAGPFKVIDGRMTLPDVTMNDLIHHARMGYVPASNPPAGASVSERARALMAQAYRDGGFPRAAGILEAGVIDSVDSCALRALEQALTQQRGEATECVCPAGSGCTRPCDRGWRRILSEARALPPSSRDNILDFIEREMEQATTTPQPSADAVREYISELRGRADTHELNGLHACSVGMKDAADRHDEKAKLQRAIADELESLISGGSHA